MGTCEAVFAHPGTMDREIVSRVQRGDRAAFGELVLRHEGKLRSVALRLTGSISDAEDVVQQALMKAFEKIRNFRGDSQFSTWVTRIVMNESLMFLRRQRRESSGRQSLHGEDGEILPEIEVAATGMDPENTAGRNELAVQLRNAIQGLPRTWSAVVFLHDIELRTIEETASVLGISVAAAKSRRLRARLELKRRLERPRLSNRCSPEQTHMPAGALHTAMTANNSAAARFTGLSQTERIAKAQASSRTD